MVTPTTTGKHTAAAKTKGELAAAPTTMMEPNATATNTAEHTAVAKTKGELAAAPTTMVEPDAAATTTAEPMSKPTAKGGAHGSDDDLCVAYDHGGAHGRAHD